ncbi:MAG: DUF5947 family protein [Acidimicrobiales bacterium]
MSDNGNPLSFLARSVSPAAGARDNTGVVDVLERFRRPRPRPGERCEMCGVEISEDHSHAVDVKNRSLMCTCRPCYLLFLPGGAGGGHFKVVPERYLNLPSAVLPRSEWEGLQIPVGVAFFFASSDSGDVHGFYPSPAGATESLLPLDAWDRIRNADPAMLTLEDDVEALLVRVPKEGEPDCYLVPIDTCYELVGHLRVLWKGFDGGTEAHRAIDAFFEELTRRAK